MASDDGCIPDGPRLLGATVAVGAVGALGTTIVEKKSGTTEIGTGSYRDCTPYSMKMLSADRRGLAWIELVYTYTTKLFVAIWRWTRLHIHRFTSVRGYLIVMTVNNYITILMVFWEFVK